MDKAIALDDPHEDELPPQGVPMEDTFEHMAHLRAKRLSIPRLPSHARKDIVVAFQDAFELIGGTTRLAVWADTNPGDFYRLYGKLLPTQSQQSVSGTVSLIVMDGVQRGALDGPATPLEGEYTEVEDD